MTEKLTSLKVTATLDSTGVTQGLQQTDRAVTSTGQSLDRLQKQIDGAYASQQKFASGSLTLQKAFETGKISADEQQRLMGLLGQRYTESSSKIQDFREILRLTTDAATGNITGMGRAGALLANSFGLITLEAAAVATGVLALGTVLVLAGIRASEAAQQTREYQAIIVATGNAAQLTGNQILSIARGQARSGPFSEDDLNKSATALLRFGSVASDSFERVISLAKDYAVVTGQALPAATQALAQHLSSGFSGIKSLNDQFHFLSAAQLIYIHQLEDQNKSTEAANIAMTALQARIGGLAETTESDMTKALKELTNSWHDFLDAIAPAASTLNGVAAALSAVAGAVKALGTAQASAASAGEAGAGEAGGAYDSGFRLPGHEGATGDFSGHAGASGSFGEDTSNYPAPPPRKPAAPGAVGGTSQSDQSRVDAAEAFATAIRHQSEALTTQSNVLAGAHNGFTLLAADELKIRLEAAASRQGILAASQAEIDRVVAIQRGIDAKSKQVALDAQDRVSGQTLQELQLELSLMGQSAEQRAKEVADLHTRNELINDNLTGQALEDEYQKRVKINEQIAAAQVGITRAQAAQKEFVSEVKELGSFAASAFNEIAFGTGTWDQRLQKIGQDFEKLIFQLTVIKPLEDAINQTASGSAKVSSGGGLLGAVGKFFSGSGSSSSTAPTTTEINTQFSGASGFGANSALGNVFDRGYALHRFAAGGIVQSPTYFPMANGGTGLMGEAGPEAVMPLTRMAGGRLGVQSGGGAPTLYVDARGSSNPAQFEMIAHRVVRQYIPGIVGASINGTVAARLRRPNLLAGTAR